MGSEMCIRDRAKRQRQIKEARLKREKMIEVIGIVSLSLAILFMFAGFFYIVARKKLWL